MVRAGQVWPLLRMAAFTRSRVSRITLSGRPVMCRPGGPLASRGLNLDQVAFDADDGGRAGLCGGHDARPFIRCPPGWGGTVSKGMRASSPAAPRWGCDCGALADGQRKGRRHGWPAAPGRWIAQAAVRFVPPPLPSSGPAPGSRSVGTGWSRGLAGRSGRVAVRAGAQRLAVQEQAQPPSAACIKVRGWAAHAARLRGLRAPAVRPERIVRSMPRCPQPGSRSRPAWQAAAKSSA